MPRPKSYQDERVDTKVRLRPDHHSRLQEITRADPSVSRNAIIEAALDLFLDGPVEIKPRLASAVEITTAAKPGETRVGRNIQRLGEGFRITGQDPEGKKPKLVKKTTRVRPRRPY